MTTLHPKSSRKSRKHKTPQKESSSELSTPSLKDILKQKIKAKRLERTNHIVLDNRIEDIADLLKKEKDPNVRLKLQKELTLLQEAEEAQFNTINNGEYPDYGDGASYGGGCEHPD